MTSDIDVSFRAVLELTGDMERRIRELRIVIEYAYYKRNLSLLKEVEVELERMLKCLSGSTEHI